MASFSGLAPLSNGNGLAGDPGGEIPVDARTKTEQGSFFVPCGEVVMFRAVVEEAAALASISLFLGMLAVWVQVFSTL
jgi:hypothetical protein